MAQAETFAIPNVTLPNAAALVALTGLLALTDGARAHVATYGADFRLITQSGGLPALVANEVLASSAAGLVWQRVLNVELPRWAQQAVWTVNPTTGNDENDGSVGNPVQTTDEIARRVPKLVIPITINVVGAAALTTPFTYNPAVQWNKALSASFPTVTLNGVETAAALPAGANGVVNVATQNAGNVPGTLSDTGGAGVVWPVGTIIRVTSGASNGAFTTVVKDQGGGVARVSPWMDANGNPVAAPANLVTYSVVTWTTVPDISVSNVGFNITKCSFTAMSTINAGNGIVKILFINCVKPSVNFIPSIPSSYTFLNCWMNGSANFLISNGCIVSVIGCGWTRQGATIAPRVTSGGRIIFANTLIQGDATSSSGLVVDGTFATDGIPGGVATVTNLGIMDTNGGASLGAVEVRKGGLLNVTGALWGAGNALKGTVVKENGHVYVQAAVTPTLAAVGQELELEGAATAFPDFRASAGAVLPALAALINWNQWAGLPFSRNVVGSQSGSTISDAA